MLKNKNPNQILSMTTIPREQRAENEIQIIFENFINV